MKKLILVLFFGLSSLFAFEDLHLNNFDQKVSKGNVIVDFYAPWWSSCKVLGENLQTYHKKTTKNIKIYSVDITKEKSLAEKYKIFTVPIMIYFKDGKQIKKTVGLKSVEDLENLEKKYF